MGDLPWYGRFGVINPEGQGRRLTLYAWGDPGDVRDLAAMPRSVQTANGSATNQAQESGALYRDIVRLNPAAPVVEVIGTWHHTAEMRTRTKLPFALRLFGLLPPAQQHAGALRIP